MMTYIWLYLVLVNLLTAAVYIWDKHQAVAHRWRVPEARLLGLAAIGGALGAPSWPCRFGVTKPTNGLLPWGSRLS